MKFWIIFGLCGQFLFFMRFLVQWIASEKKKKSVIPTSFWYFSLGGSLILLTYSIYRKDPVFILGQSLGFMIYARNLILIARHKEQQMIK
ncbi:MAG: lipid-A-disaccharide synthase N-terminal domain-containing protein [Candidatus Omnitrophica bacterium]|nr:lipid-A-disaccharide synthase N-terminal domain-containing protein [Candidatus Omnitrophota bacterium]